MFVWRWPSLVLSRKIVLRFLFPHLSSPAIDGMMSLALFLQVVSQVPQHFRSSETQATCARHSICLVISLYPGMSGTAHPQEFSKVDVDHWHIPVWAPHSTFCSKLIESVRMMACVVWLSPLETNQWRSWVFSSIHGVYSPSRHLCSSSNWNLYAFIMLRPKHLDIALFCHDAPSVWNSPPREMKTHSVNYGI